MSHDPTPQTARQATPLRVCLEEISRLCALAAADPALEERLQRVAAHTVRALRCGKKVLLCGNGGSAAQATHLAGEIVGPFFNRQRPGWAAIPLGFDPSSLTAIANDLSYDQIFSRQIEAFGQPGDQLWVFTSTGRSPNILKAMQQARLQGLSTVLFANHDGGPAKEWADFFIPTPPASTPRVQELQLVYGHWLCEWIEAELTK